MEQVWQRGLDVIIFVQKIRSPFADNLFFSISFFGTHVFYISLLLLLYWCADKKNASRIIILFLISSWSNTLLKDLIHHPRPYNLNEAVKIGNSGGYGLPSGHAQHSLVMGVSLAIWLKERWFTCFTAAAVLLIALSRIYLGVHFPTDILGGWFAGAVILILFWKVFHRAEKILNEISPYIVMPAFIFIPALLSLVLASKWTVMSMGVLSGFSIGLILEKKYLNFTGPENFRTGLLRFVLGIILLLIILSSDVILKGINFQFYPVTVFVYSWVSGIWVSAGAPWLFKKFGI